MKIDMDELYLDQVGFAGISTPGFTMGSCYTPTGIRRMDKLFCDRIRAFKQGKSFTQLNWRGEVEWVWNDTKASLAKEIRENPHLHPTIKENLLFNLGNK